MQKFVDEVMELVELDNLRDAIVGLPGVTGLSTEQRKRLTIAVELVANPSIIFMDEPTSGLDARAAAIVMRTVRNTVNTGRTVVCTIHQPSIDIFDAFDQVINCHVLSFDIIQALPVLFYFMLIFLRFYSLLFLFSVGQLLLLKRGGQVIYAGELGSHSRKMIRYFEVPSIFKYSFYMYIELHFLKTKTLFLFIVLYPRQFLECPKYRIITTLQLGCLK